MEFADNQTSQDQVDADGIVVEEASDKAQGRWDGGWEAVGVEDKQECFEEFADCFVGIVRRR